MSLLIAEVARRARETPHQIAVQSGAEYLTYAMLPFAVASAAARIHRADPSSAPVHVGQEDAILMVIDALAVRQLGRTVVTLSLPPALHAQALADAGAICSLGSFRTPLAWIDYTYDDGAITRIDRTEEQALAADTGPFGCFHAATASAEPLLTA